VGRWIWGWLDVLSHRPIYLSCNSRLVNLRTGRQNLDSPVLSPSFHSHRPNSPQPRLTAPLPTASTEDDENIPHRLASFDQLPGSTDSKFEANRSGQTMHVVRISAPGCVFLDLSQPATETMRSAIREILEETASVRLMPNPRRGALDCASIEARLITEI